VTQPRLRPQNESERAFLAIGGGAERWLRGAAASGTARVRSKMGQATELALLFGSADVDQALSRAASVARFGDDDLISILAHAQQSQETPVWLTKAFRPSPGQKPGRGSVDERSGAAAASFRGRRTVQADAAALSAPGRP